jgi:hypothetical protein
MPRPRILTQLALYAVALLCISGVVVASVSFLAGSFNAIAPSAPKLETPPQKNVPLPPVIEPEAPVIERPISRPARESSFATVAPPSPGGTETAVGAPAGTSESFVTLGAPQQPAPTP